jgi:hypothetical protein
VVRKRPAAAWDRGTQVQLDGRIWGGNEQHDAWFVDAYGAKHRSSPNAVATLTARRRRSATLKLVPRK